MSAEGLRIKVAVSWVICECGHIMYVDDDGGYTCFNQRCLRAGATIALRITPEERTVGG